MRSLALVSMIAACGGSQKSAQTTPANDAPEPLRKDGGDVTGAPTPPPPPPVDDKALCDSRPDEFGPVVLTAELAQARHGSGARTFADAPSTKDQPIEVCGIPGQHQWLMATACADGSKAYQHEMQVTQSRAGNVGAGGRCDSIVDHYVATCPEAEYHVYIDMYMCGPNETF